MNNEKYGFIYLWFDKKHKKYYVGRHWGTIDDGYICSSVNMRNNYKNRPGDFKRRIISYIITNVEDLVTEEQRWLSMIKPSECKVRYYNVSLSATTPSSRGHKMSEETKLKMRNSALGRKLSDETKEKLRQINTGKKLSEETKQKISTNHNRDYSDEIFLNKMKEINSNRSEETRKKISENNKRLIAEGKIGMKGRKHSPETKEKMKISAMKRTINKSKVSLEEYKNAI